MKFSKKYIIPIALIKITLFFVILQLFFTSCESEEIINSNSRYTEGPLFEIEASLVCNSDTFEIEANNIIKTGDTLYLTIGLTNTTLYDQISTEEVTLSSPVFNSQIAISDSEGNTYCPRTFEVSGQIDSLRLGVYSASFGAIETQVEKSSVVLRLKLGFIIKKAGDYTFYFINTPNNFTSEGSTDIYYNQSSIDEKDYSVAYAVYLFDLEEGSVDYGQNEENDAEDTDNNYKTDILKLAGADQAIMEFTVIEED